VARLWRDLSQEQRATEMKTDAVADWRVSDWINLTPDRRQRRRQS
jgi:hypothetical protein